MNTNRDVDICVKRLHVTSDDRGEDVASHAAHAQEGCCVSDFGTRARTSSAKDFRRSPESVQIVLPRHDDFQC